MAEFRHDTSRKAGTRECKSCASAKRRAWYAATVETRREKRREHYQANRETVLAKQRAWAEARPPEAREATREYFRQRYAGSRDEVRDKRLQRQFGITLAEYDARLEAQQGGCAICRGINSDGRRLAVDHDHTTGAVRGLLCADCNRALGMFNDSRELLGVAIAYLEAADGRLHAVVA
jgi:hypothetical protein